MGKAVVLRASLGPLQALEVDLHWVEQEAMRNGWPEK